MLFITQNRNNEILPYRSNQQHPLTAHLPAYNHSRSRGARGALGTLSRPSLEIDCVVVAAQR